MIRWIGLAAGLVVLTGAATLLYQLLPESSPEPTIELHHRDEGPPPKLQLVGEKVHNFGTMTANIKGSHTWLFKNVGRPLRVWLENTSCSCTVAELKTDEGEPKKTVTVAPGRSVPLDVTWEARRWSPSFGQTATVGTNDPDNATVNLSVVGRIVAPVEVEPSESIDFAEIFAETPHRRTVALVSADRPDLKLLKLATSRPGLIVADARPMAADELARRHVKSGYNLTVELRPGLSPGRFTEELRIDTDHPNRPALKLTVAGTAIGPISLIPSGLVIPRVTSREGASKDIRLIVRGGGTTNFAVASKPEGLDVAIAPDDRAGTTGRYRVTVTVPPGTSPGVRDDPIVLKTDHPRIHEVKIPVRIYVSSQSGAG